MNLLTGIGHFSPGGVGWHVMTRRRGLGGSGGLGDDGIWIALVTVVFLIPAVLILLDLFFPVKAFESEEPYFTTRQKKARRIKNMKAAALVLLIVGISLTIGYFTRPVKAKVDQAIKQYITGAPDTVKVVPVIQIPEEGVNPALYPESNDSLAFNRMKEFVEKNTKKEFCIKAKTDNGEVWYIVYSEDNFKTQYRLKTLRDGTYLTEYYGWDNKEEAINIAKRFKSMDQVREHHKKSQIYSNNQWKKMQKEIEEYRKRKRGEPEEVIIDCK